MATSTLKTLYPWLQENSTETSSGNVIKSYSYDNNATDDVLCLVHGYPQSSYMWRHVLEAWKPHASLYIPELPGYGISTQPNGVTSYNKRAIGFSILEALAQVIPNATTQNKRIHWIGHDRGARIGHRILTSPDPWPAPISSAVFIDIVPTLAQWRAFSHPAASIAYFHWPFLATSTAPEIIEGMGGDAFCRLVLARGRGSNEEGVAKLEAHDAYGHYAALFAKPETIRGSCADYADGGVEESEAQEKEQGDGVKVRVPLLAVYSREYLGRMHDVEAVWREWVEDSGKIRFVGVGDGHGHYLPESADERVAREVVGFISGRK